MTTLKVCGLRDSASAVVAADAGADFLGFVFVPGARRRLALDHARDIVERYRGLRGERGPRLVGLFADQPAEQINHALEYCRLDVAQLCGDEPPDYWQRVSAPIIKQIKVRDHGDGETALDETLRQVSKVNAAGHITTLDRYEVGALGGTGRAFDWSIAADIAQRESIWLAGGLTPENVADAIATVAPSGVDVSSGVETGGVKDAGKIVAFAAAVKRAASPTGVPRTP